MKIFYRYEFIVCFLTSFLDDRKKLSQEKVCKSNCI